MLGALLLRTVQDDEYNDCDSRQAEDRATLEARHAQPNKKIPHWMELYNYFSTRHVVLNPWAATRRAPWALPR